MKEILVVKISEIGVEKRVSLLKTISYFLSLSEHSRNFFKALGFETIALRAAVFIPISKEGISGHFSLRQ